VRNLEIELGETLSLRMMRTPGDRLNRVNSWFQLAKTPQSQPGGRDAAERGDTRGASGPPGSRLRVEVEADAAEPKLAEAWRGGGTGESRG